MEIPDRAVWMAAAIGESAGPFASGSPSWLAKPPLTVPSIVDPAALLAYVNATFDSSRRWLQRLSAMALGLPAFMVIKVLASAYYSRQDMRTPVLIGIKAMVANMVLNLLFVVPLHLFWQVGHMGLSLATTGVPHSIASTCTSPKHSVCDGSASTSHAAYTFASVCASSTSPRKRTASFAAATRGSSSVLVSS